MFLNRKIKLIKYYILDDEIDISNVVPKDMGHSIFIDMNPTTRDLTHYGLELKEAIARYNKVNKFSRKKKKL